jgi:hypothetical protein
VLLNIRLSGDKTLHHILPQLTTKQNNPLGYPTQAFVSSRIANSAPFTFKNGNFLHSDSPKSSRREKAATSISCLDSSRQYHCKAMASGCEISSVQAERIRRSM